MWKQPTRCDLLIRGKTGAKHGLPAPRRPPEVFGCLACVFGYLTNTDTPPKKDIKT